MTLARGLQLTLFNVDPMLRAHNTGSARNAYGMAAQHIVCETLGLRPIPIDGRCGICLDAEDGEIFYEIKSVRTTGKIVIYDWRLEKELSSGVPVMYAILIHSLRGAREDILNAMRQCAPRILLIPLYEVAYAAREQAQRRYLKPRSARANGYNRKGYAQGYRNIPLRRLLNVAGAEIVQVPCS